MKDWHPIALDMLREDMADTPQRTQQDLRELLLLAKAKFDALPPERQARLREEQRLSFAYGNLAMTSNHRPTRASFDWLIRRECPTWTDDERNAWLDARQWW